MSSNTSIYLSQEQIDRILDDYKNPGLSTRDITLRNGIGKKKMMQLVRKHGVPERGRHKQAYFFRGRAKKTTIGAMNAAVSAFSDVAIERAKLTLRQRGHIVFDAEVTDGYKAKGYFRCDGKLWTREQVMEAAE